MLRKSPSSILTTAVSVCLWDGISAYCADFRSGLALSARSIKSSRGCE
jgi:hypothetical protein